MSKPEEKRVNYNVKKVLFIFCGMLWGSIASGDAPVNNIYLSISTDTSPVEIKVEWSQDLTGVIDLFTTTDLNTSVWELISIDLIPEGITNFHWSGLDMNDHSAHFFTAGNGGADSDGDLLSNAQEFLTYHTNPTNPDTDGDGISDGDEIHGNNEVQGNGNIIDADGFTTDPLVPDRADYDLPGFTSAGPTDNLNGFSAFDPPSGGSVTTNAPVIAEWTRINNPGDTMAITGERLSDSPHRNDSSFVFFSQTAEGRVVRTGEINRLDGRQAAITLPDILPPNQMYLMWPLNQNGWGKPVAINQTDAWWIGPDKVAREGTFSVFGRSLVADQDNPVSYAYVVDSEGNGKWLTSISANPYRADFSLPTSQDNGTYTVWAHNGLGNAYGWSRSLELTVEDPVVWDGPTFNVMDYGATGDGETDDFSSIQSALQDAKNADFATVYFPEGTYLTSKSVHDAKYDLRLMGDGMDKTTISTHPNYGQDPNLNFGLFFSRSQEGPVEFRDMTLSTGPYMATSSIGPSLVEARDGKNFTYVNVRFSQLGHLDQTDHTPILNLGGSSYINFVGCEFILAGSVDVNNGARQLLFEDCTAKAIHENEFMFNIGASSETRILNCLAQNYDNSDPDSGRGWGQGRFVYGPGREGAVTDVYYSGNETVNLTVREKFTENQNTGEQFMSEFNRTLFRGAPESATDSTVKFASLPENFSGKTIVVVGGTGLGQNRTISSSSTDGSVNITEPWNVPPGSDSILMIGNFAARQVVYNNIFDGVERAVVTDVPSTAGVMPYGSQVDMVVDNNYFHQLKHGISLWGIQNEINGEILTRPLFFNLFMNNTLDRCRRAIDNSIATYSGTPTYWDINLLGNVFRNNYVTNSTEYAFRNRTWEDDHSIALCIYDNNTSIDCKTNIGDDRGMKNQIWIRNNFTTFTGGTGIKISSDHIPVLRENTWEGFDENYGGETPGGILELPRRVVQALASRQAVPIWNSGTEPMHWVALEASSWLTLTSNSSGTLARNVYPQASLTASGGFLSDEGDEGILSFDISEAPAGETASIVVLSQNEVKIITVVVGDSHAVNTEPLKNINDGKDAASEIKKWLSDPTILTAITAGVGSSYRNIPYWKCAEDKTCWEHWTEEDWGGFWQKHNALDAWHSYLKSRKNKTRPPDPEELIDLEIWEEFWSSRWDWEDWEDLLRDELTCVCIEDWNNVKDLNEWKSFWKTRSNWKDCNCWENWSRWEDWTAFWKDRKNWTDSSTWEEWQESWKRFLVKAQNEKLSQVINEWLTEE